MSEKKLVAVVNGKEISQQDVLKFLNDMGPQMAMQFQSSEGIQRVVEELVNQELLYLDAIENNFEKEEEFQKVMEETKINLLKNFAFNKVIANIDTTKEELVEFYNQYKDNFNKPESVVASHILVDNEEKAKNIIKEINEGLSFEEAATKYSSCPSKEAGGSLGEFTRGQMVPEFEKAAFEMEVGTVSTEPVKSQFGYHIIKVAAKNEGQESKLEDVEEEVKAQVIRLKQQERYMEKIEELKGKYEVKTDFK